jgi:hypothetical protein
MGFTEPLTDWAPGTEIKRLLGIRARPVRESDMLRVDVTFRFAGSDAVYVRRTLPVLAFQVEAWTPTSGLYVPEGKPS